MSLEYFRKSNDKKVEVQVSEESFAYALCYVTKYFFLMGKTIFFCQNTEFAGKNTSVQ